VSREHDGDPATGGSDPVASPLRRWWVPRAVATGLWLLIISAVLFAGLAWARPVVSSEPPTIAAGEAARWDVAGFAELFVSQFVDAGDGDEAALAPFMGNSTPASLSGSESGQWFASSTTTTEIAETGLDRWRVTVATALLRRDAETSGYVSMGVRFFEVEVVATGSGLSATSLPWIAPAPPVGEPSARGWGNGGAPADGDPLADTIERFLVALLTGNGELGRYAAPGSELRAVPATFDDVELRRVATRQDDQGDHWVRASVQATSAESVLWLTYDLLVEERDGRWEIVAMGPQPVATGSPDIPVPSTTTAVVENSTQGDEER
ncbi:MAG: conjugal transfer protein, partial [Ilumatobacter sp.]|uniref:conjugal transfer protein n=1 Tax=Ilumatobacter sp. TaxID=1967498 RepID=UPI003C78035E